MNNRPDKPDMFNYRKSSVYLADLIHWYKGNGTSLRNLARKLEVSPSLLSLIANGQRQLTEEHVDIWANVFEWSPSEVAWLKKLVLLDSASTEQKREAVESMGRFKNYAEKSSDEIITFKYLQKWWNVAIREMSALPDFQEEENWIQKRLLFKVSILEIRKSLRFLNKHKLLAKYGMFRHLDCQGDIYRISLSTFHQQILQKAVESIYAVPSEERHILGHTLNISKEKLPELKNILDETLEKITKLAESSDKSQEIYHVGLLGFPLTKEIE